jgi:hypothetical protein
VKRLLSLILFSSLSLLQAQLCHGQPTAPSAQSDTAPRVYGITLGGSYVFLNRLPLREQAPAEVRPGGVQLAARFGWQVRGLRGGAPATVGFETDLLFQPAPRARDSYALIYGVFAKHSFSSRLRVRPFFSYGLGAAQVWVTSVGGRGIGHASRLGFGVDVRLRERWHVSLAITYQGILMPRFALDDGRARDTSFHGCLLSSGVWFGS